MNPDYAWFNKARFGMFIHWGAYSVGARGEWFRNRERIPHDEYVQLYANHFLAENYDPKAWAALAKEAGMGYMVLTARHHDGFALWPTATSRFHAGNYGPKRDLVGPYIEAARSAGLKVGLYYSPADWSHPDYPGPYFRDWPAEADWASVEARERFIAYYRAQLVELLTNYGRIDYLWFDGCIPDDLRRRDVNEELLRLQPHLLINERNGPPSHVKISEQAIRAPKDPGALWEACMTLNDNWGWHAGDSRWKDASEIVRMLCETAKSGGNLLLNIGPKSDGSIPTESIQLLRRAGAWLARHSNAFANSDSSPFPWNNWGYVLVKGNRVHLVIRNSPGHELCWAELRNRVLSARWLDTGKPIIFDQTGDLLRLRGLPFPLRDPIASVIELLVEGVPTPVTPQTNFWIPGDPV